MTPPAAAKIAYILRLPTNRYRILLDCGHRRAITAAELEREQLFVGKTVKCAECGSERTS